MSIFDDFVRMQRSMERMMADMDRQFASTWTDWNMNPSLLGDVNTQPLLTSGQQDVRPGKAREEEKTQHGGQLTTTDSQSTSLAPFGGVGGGLSLWSPRVDIVERPDRYLVTADIPGLPKENLKVDLNADTGMLTISGQTQHENEQRDGDKWVRRERSSGSFTRALRVPNDINKDGLKARLEHGVLTVDIPRINQQGDKKLKETRHAIKID